MRSEAKHPNEYFENLPEERREVMKALRKEILNNLPKGFAEHMAYGMPCYVVPHSIYPKGYHCDPKQALPFMSLASQKNHMAFYHMGLYADEKLYKWFQEAYEKETGRKPDLGKSCLRFKRPEQIPVKLIGQLVARMPVKDWIALYEKNLRR